MRCLTNTVHHFGWGQILELDVGYIVARNRMFFVSFSSSKALLQRIRYLTHCGAH